MNLADPATQACITTFVQEKNIEVLVFDNLSCQMDGNARKETGKSALKCSA